jgi:aryl-alcohol dehydrogenase-like predicted oxidoreductase
LESKTTRRNRILDAAADTGINFLDTADFYPMGAAHAQLGGTEEITGRWLKGKRHRFIVASKAGAPMSPLSAREAEPLSETNVNASAERSP